ncbi:MAG: 4-hydroxy-3-methylbut-2-enyl diphosphate reductase [Acidobacteria bacterium]|nr:MAG: 4-hydroxy-3-methylbut-2-enyl diphosphate reductase [Acidobacteriota bacterium]
MKIIVAESAGFCWGVRRAMEKALHLAESAENRDIHTLGPLIHNTQVVEFLSSRGVKEIHSPDEADEGTVIIRAHGATPETLEKLKKSGAKVANATCPRVGKVQALIKGHLAKGYEIIIIGDTGHAEVQSLMGYAKNRAHLVQTPIQAMELPLFEKAIVVSQTTFDRKVFDEIVEQLQEKTGELKVFCTICDSTAKRQDEVKKLASKVDCMIIVGGHHSANTTRLAEISRRYCKHVYHIETAADLVNVDIRSYQAIGVSAGASTPNWIINSVVQALRFKDKEKAVSFQLFGWMFYGGIFRSLAAFFLCFGILNMFHLPVSWKFPLIAFFYLFSITNLNGIVSGEALLFSDPTRYHFIQSRRKSLVFFSVVSILSVLALGLTLSRFGFFMLLFSVLLGVLYRIRIGIGKKPFRIFDIPGSKNLFHGLAWSIVIAAIPLLENGICSWNLLITGPGLVFMIVFAGTVLFDFKDYQGDQFAGKETLPILLGRNRAAALVFRGTAILTCFITVIALVTGQKQLSVTLALSAIYILLVFAHYSNKSTIPSDGKFEFIVDGIALVPWLISLLLSIASRI